MTTLFEIEKELRIIAADQCWGILDFTYFVPGFFGDWVFVGLQGFGKRYEKRFSLEEFSYERVFDWFIEVKYNEEGYIN